LPKIKPPQGLLWGWQQQDTVLFPVVSLDIKQVRFAFS